MLLSFFLPFLISFLPFCVSLSQRSAYPSFLRPSFSLTRFLHCFSLALSFSLGLFPSSFNSVSFSFFSLAFHRRSLMFLRGAFVEEVPKAHTFTCSSVLSLSDFNFLDFNFLARHPSLFSFVIRQPFAVASPSLLLFSCLSSWPFLPSFAFSLTSLSRILLCRPVALERQPCRPQPAFFSFSLWVMQ